MKPLVIYHANCTDGFGAAFAAWLKLGNEAEYLPMEHGVNLLATYKGSLIAREIYILDFSFSRETTDWLFGHAKRVVWLDHHKTAFEMWCGKAPDLFFTLHKEQDESKTITLDDCKSGALLAWEYFHPSTEVPMLIKHIDDYDRWQFKMEGSKELHAALSSYKPWTFERWLPFLSNAYWDNKTQIEIAIEEGTAILRAHNQHVQVALKQARPCEIWSFKPFANAPGSVTNGFIRYSLNGLAANAPPFLASDLGHELANKSGTFGLVWSLAADRTAHCSLRSNGDYDVSAIAKAFGGGGHRNAAGFSTDMGTLIGWLK